ncbi:MAG: organomercurial lyase MerB [Gammaproteobacteria bacterium]|nr:MAG: organomercurial lyase MerB [Gammaproteobacteria bacterium]
MWRRLVSGRAVTAEETKEIIAEISITRERAERLLQSVAEHDGDGNIVGILGLSLRDHMHRFEVNGRALSTWCAVDTLFLPAMLGQPASVTSQSPVAKTEVRLIVGPEGVRTLDPPGATISIPDVDYDASDTESAGAIMGSFCHRIYFFATREEGEQWADGRDDFRIVSVHEGFEYAMEIFSGVLSHAEALGS